MRAYDENADRVSSVWSARPEDEEGSIANLVPGGRVSERPQQGGAAVLARERSQIKPLKVQTDMDLVRPALFAELFERDELVGTQRWRVAAQLRS